MMCHRELNRNEMLREAVASGRGETASDTRCHEETHISCCSARMNFERFRAFLVFLADLNLNFAPARSNSETLPVRRVLKQARGKVECRALEPAMLQVDPQRFRIERFSKR